MLPSGRPLSELSSTALESYMALTHAEELVAHAYIDPERTAGFPGRDGLFLTRGEGRQTCCWDRAGCGCIRAGNRTSRTIRVCDQWDMSSGVPSDQCATGTKNTVTGSSPLASANTGEPLELAPQAAGAVRGR